MSRRPSFDNDFLALEYINKHISSHDLILTDFSYTSKYMYSLSFKNLTIFNPNFRRSDLQEMWQVWENPYNSSNIIKILRKYEIKYILLTSEWGFNSWFLPGGGGYKGLPFPPSKYAEIFDSYAFLEPVFKKGSTRIYKV